MKAFAQHILWIGLLACSVSCAEQDPAGRTEPQAGYFYGRATKVFDGDTLAVKTTDGRNIRVRVAEIDAPEKGKPYANRARQALTDMVWKQGLVIRVYDVDSYQRIVGHVLVGDRDAGRELVRTGLAVVYCRYATDETLKELEKQAREKKLGIWSQAEIPRGWREDCRDVARPLPTRCGDKQFCSQMESCTEALFYLRECGVTTLDGNNDGLPCEAKLCKN